MKKTALEYPYSIWISLSIILWVISPTLGDDGEESPSPLDAEIKTVESTILSLRKSRNFEGLVGLLAEVENRWGETDQTTYGTLSLEILGEISSNPGMDRRRLIGVVLMKGDGIPLDTRIGLLRLFPRTIAAENSTELQWSIQRREDVKEFVKTLELINKMINPDWNPKRTITNTIEAPKSAIAWGNGAPLDLIQDPIERKEWEVKFEKDREFQKYDGAQRDLKELKTALITEFKIYVKQAYSKESEVVKSIRKDIKSVGAKIELVDELVGSLNLPPSTSVGSESNHSSATTKPVVQTAPSRP